jgi:hypothetical protein
LTGVAQDQDQLDPIRNPLHVLVPLCRQCLIRWRHVQAPIARRCSEGALVKRIVKRAGQEIPYQMSLCLELVTPLRKTLGELRNPLQAPIVIAGEKDAEIAG